MEGAVYLLCCERFLRFLREFCCPKDAVCYDRMDVAKGVDGSAKVTAIVN